MGGIEAMLIRIQLAVPNNDFLSAGLFNEMITMHGTTMIFLAAMPILFAFMNAVVPLQIGARDLAFPFMNALGVWMFILGGIFVNISSLFGDAPDAGWTSYASLSIASPGHGIDFYAIGLQIAGAGTLIRSEERRVGKECGCRGEPEHAFGRARARCPALERADQDAGCGRV